MNSISDQIHTEPCIHVMGLHVVRSCSQNNIRAVLVSFCLLVEYLALAVYVKAYIASVFGWILIIKTAKHKIRVNKRYHICNKYVCIHVHINTSYKYMHINLHVFICMYLYVYIIYKYIGLHIYIYTYIYTFLKRGGGVVINWFFKKVLIALISSLTRCSGHVLQNLSI